MVFRKGIYKGISLFLLFTILLTLGQGLIPGNRLGQIVMATQLEDFNVYEEEEQDNEPIKEEEAEELDVETPIQDDEAAPDELEIIEEFLDEELIQEDMVTPNSVLNYTICVIKLDENGKKLSGAVFELLGSNKKVIQTSNQTGRDGQVNFSVKSGEYYIREKTAPDGYKLDKNLHSVKVGFWSNWSETVTVKNQRIIEDYSFIKVDSNHQPIAGATFGLFRGGSTQPIQTSTSNQEGTVKFTGLEFGTYTLKEIEAPRGYLRDEGSYTIQVLDGRVVGPTYIKNTFIKADVKVFKKDGNTQTPLAGATFGLFDAGAEAPRDIKITNNQGYVSFTQVPYGNYYVKELEAPNGYQIQMETQDIIIDNNQTKVLTFLNSPILSGIQIKKVDATNSEIGLKGAKFEIYNHLNAIVATVSTNEDGIAMVENLTYGTYTAKEIEAPYGYRVDENSSQDFTISNESSGIELVFENTPILRKLTITKLDAVTNEPLAGAKFEVYTDSHGLIYQGVTNEEGVLYVPALGYGTYKVIEVDPPEGYQKDSEEQFVTINSEDEIYAVTFRNQPILRSYKLIKVDATNKLIKLENAVFEIYDTKDQLVDTVTTNSEGLGVTKELRLGQYYLKEIQAPIGYIPSTENIEIEVKESIKANFTVVRNLPIQKGLTINKVDGTDSNIGLAGAKFDIIDTKGNIIKVTTDETGTVVISDLRYGDYTIKETQAPYGYELQTEEQKITINGDTENYIVTFKNNPILKDIVITKVDANDLTKKLSNAVFKLYQEDEVIREIRTDEDGIGHIEGIPYGEYLLKEDSSPIGYLNDKASYPIKIDADSDDVIEVLVKNHRVRTLVVEKVDKNNHNIKLPNARFELWNADKHLVATLRSNQLGVITFDNLNFGSYTLKEITAPSGYRLSREELIINFNESDQDSKLYVIFENERLPSTPTTPDTSTPPTYTYINPPVKEELPVVDEEEVVSEEEVEEEPVLENEESEVSEEEEYFDIQEEEIPLDDLIEITTDAQLPKTGEARSGFQYLLGSFMLGIGLVLRKRF